MGRRQNNWRSLSFPPLSSVLQSHPQLYSRTLSPVFPSSLSPYPKDHVYLLLQTTQPLIPLSQSTTQTHNHWEHSDFKTWETGNQLLIFTSLFYPPNPIPLSERPAYAAWTPSIPDPTSNGTNRSSPQISSFFSSPNTSRHSLGTHQPSWTENQESEWIR